MLQGPVIHQAYRFVLEPTVEQQQFLVACAGASRFWFNQGLSLVKQRLDARQSGADVEVPWSYRGLCGEFRGDAVKDQLAPWRNEVVVGSYQAGLEALGNALQSFSRGRAAGRPIGFPRFRSKGRSHEAVIFQRPRLIDTRHVDLDRRIAPIRTAESMRKLTRLLGRDPQARVLRSTVQLSRRRWVISFAVERAPKQRRARRPNAAIGVDLGLARLATISTGHTAENSRPLQAQLLRLRRLQRQLDRQRRANNPGNYDARGRVTNTGRSPWVQSRRMARTEQRVARVHQRIANQRRDQAHRLTTALVREFGVIGVEDLAVKNMLRNRRLARQIADTGWGMVLNQLKYKTLWSDGSMLVVADRFYPSSKTCSACGAVKAKLLLGDRIFRCDCGHVHDRDHNASVNLARMACRHAEARGISSYVARTGRFTQTARRGQVSLVDHDQHSPLKREDPFGSSRRGDASALAG